MWIASPAASTASASARPSSSRSALGASDLKGDIKDAVVEPALKDEPVQLDAKRSSMSIPRSALVGDPRCTRVSPAARTPRSYGEYSRYSGSALSGKDPLRIDRVAIMRLDMLPRTWLRGAAEECEVQLSYSIAFRDPSAFRSIPRHRKDPRPEILALVRSSSTFASRPSSGS